MAGYLLDLTPLSGTGPADKLGGEFYTGETGIPWGPGYPDGAYDAEGTALGIELPLGLHPSEREPYAGDGYSSQQTPLNLPATPFAGTGPADKLGGEFYTGETGIPWGPGYPDGAYGSEGNVLGVYVPGSPADDFLGRIWLLTSGAPVASIIIGNLIAEHTQTITVWNAYLASKTLDSLDFNPALGAFMTGPAPRTLASFEEVDYLLTIPIDGPPTVISDLTFTFGDAEDPVLHVEASITVALIFAPDWSLPLREKLAWLTDVMRSYNQKEQRTRLRRFPRRGLVYRVLVEPWQTGAFNARVYGQQSRAFVVPFWPDASFLGATLPAASVVIPVTTTGRDFFVGGFGMLISRDGGEAAFYAGGETAEVVEVTGVNPGSIELANPTSFAWKQESIIVPARSGRLREVQAVERVTNSVASALLDLELEDLSPELAPLIGLDTYKGEEVLPIIFEHDWSDPVRDDFRRALDRIDNQTGLFVIDARRDTPNIIQRKRWLLCTREEIEERKRWLFQRAGRAISFWAPFETKELEPINIAAGLTLQIRHIGYQQFYGTKENRRDLVLEEFDGTRHYREVVDVDPGPPGAEILTVDSTFGSIQLADIKSLRFLGRVRLESDEAELEYLTAEVAVLNVSFRLL